MRKGGDDVGSFVLTRTILPTASADAVRGEVLADVNRIKQMIDGQRALIKQFHAELPHLIRSAIEARRNRLSQGDLIIQKLNIPIRTKPGLPNFRPISVKRRVVVALPAAPTQGVVEYGITNQTYDEILRIIRHVGRTFELTPKTFRKHDEEELRDIINANLNGVFEGAASAEVFRVTGRTDICIEEQHRAAFVAECKVWRGPAKIAEALDQLLAYTLWRDSKIALIVFNTDVAGFTELREKMAAALAGYRRYRRTIPSADPGEWRIIVADLHDDRREVTVHAFAFNLYVPSAT